MYVNRASFGSGPPGLAQDEDHFLYSEGFRLHQPRSSASTSETCPPSRFSIRPRAALTARSRAIKYQKPATSTASGIHEIKTANALGTSSSEGTSLMITFLSLRRVTKSLSPTA